MKERMLKFFNAAISVGNSPLFISVSTMYVTYKLGYAAREQEVTELKSDLKSLSDNGGRLLQKLLEQESQLQDYKRKLTDERFSFSNSWCFYRLKPGEEIVEDKKENSMSQLKN